MRVSIFVVKGMHRVVGWENTNEAYPVGNIGWTIFYVPIKVTLRTYTSAVKEYPMKTVAYTILQGIMS